VARFRNAIVVDGSGCRLRLSLLAGWPSHGHGPHTSITQFHFGLAQAGARCDTVSALQVPRRSRSKLQVCPLRLLDYRIANASTCPHGILCVGINHYMVRAYIMRTVGQFSRHWVVWGVEVV